MKLKRFLAPLVASVITVGAMPVVTANAVSPRVYIDISCDSEGETRAYVTFENMPYVYAAGFHIELGDGWKLKPNKRGKYTGQSENYVMTTGASILGTANGEHGYFIQILSSEYDSKLEGHTYSFLIEKTENFNSSNSAINVVFEEDDFILNFENREYNYIIKDGNDTAPPMLEAQEYIVGDVNNDGRVNAVDASLILSKTQNNKSYTVDSIKYTYKTIFPEANCAAAPDADKDGHINFIDANKISQYYADMSTDEQNNSSIGKREFYEIFAD